MNYIFNILKLIIVFCLILLEYSFTLLYTSRIFRLHIHTTGDFPLRANNLLLLYHLILLFILQSLIFSFMQRFLPLVLSFIIIIVIVIFIVVIIIINLISILISKLVLQIFPDRMSKSFWFLFKLRLLIFLKFWYFLRNCLHLTF